MCDVTYFYARLDEGSLPMCDVTHSYVYICDVKFLCVM